MLQLFSLYGNYNAGKAFRIIKGYRSTARDGTPARNEILWQLATRLQHFRRASDKMDIHSHTKNTTNHSPLKSCFYR